MPGPDATTICFTAAVVILCLCLGVSALRYAHRQRSEHGDPIPPLRPGAAWRARADLPAAADAQALARRICTAFQLWLAENEDCTNLWSSFDQLVREMLSEHVGASRARCYRVQPGCATLQTISQARKAPATNGPSARAGVLGHVATTGTEFVASDPSSGPLLADLAARSEDTWAWAWPIRENDVTVGVVAAGSLRDPAALTSDARHTVGQLISLCWRHVARVEQLRIVQKTDQASGVLTRNDFFTLAGQALADSYRENEPVVLVALALEGLRRLDDTGRWRQRDTLVEQLGRLITRRLRSDDLVGRFSDDRFVVLLRRLDSALGRLIAEKILAAANDCVGQLGVASTQPCLRVGLAGSGFAHTPLEDLLVAAFDGVERARHQNLPIASDVEQHLGTATATPPGRTTEESAP